ncbi:MAG: LCP family protein [Actinomycetota bacterium]|nr:LCP family protein [Actinomycetota bacterium]
MADDAKPPAGPADDQRLLEGGHRRTVAVVVVVTQLVVAAVTATVVYFGYDNLDGNIPEGLRIEHVVPEPESEDTGEAVPVNILVMGEDTRSGEGNAIDGETGGGGSDTTILLHVSADREDAYGVSLPRDAMVARPRCESDGETVPAADPVMFNEAFALAGPRCTVTMVESLTGIYIDHFVVLDFNGFKAMVDAVHGVQVCIPEDVDDDQHNIHFEAGTQELDGDAALDYVRERYVLSVTGDIGRMKRQQAFIASMANKVLSAGTLSRPMRVYNFLKAVTRSIKVDDNLDSLAKMADLVRNLQGPGLSDIKFLTVPIAEYEPDPNRLQWTDAAKDLWRRIRDDKPLGPTLSKDSLNVDDPVGTPDKPPTGGSGDPDPDEAEERLANGLCA